ncbi:MAG TPA: type II CAAX endopeptidase family protein [Bacillales bacterium]|nr:type II CAAX endopeptidase family protein [Bacillales bacterium]
MPKRYWWVLATYVIMQLSGLVGVLPFLYEGFTKEQAAVIWSLISFISALIVILILLRKDMKASYRDVDRASVDQSILWGFLGILIAFGAQLVSGVIEQALGVHHASENTQRITEIARDMPLFIIVVAIVGPILEEIVFRKVLFGSLYKRFDFAIAAVISSILFGLAHMELSFLLTYSAMGFVFAFLYAKTKRILVPIAAHASMNTFVVLVNVIFADDIQKYMDRMKEVQQLITWFFS